MKKFQKSDDEISCEKLASLETHPLECCIYPQFIDDLANVTHKCSILCKSLPAPPFHCLKNCKITESGVIVRGKFNGSKAINLFYEGGYEDPTNMTEKWMKIVKKSTKNCENEVPTETDITGDDYNYFYTKFIECIRMENFLNCPDFSKASNCQKVKELIEKCNDSNYPMLHEFFFESIYYKNNLNVTLKWTTRTTSLGTPYPTEEATTEEISTTVEVEETEPAELKTTKTVTKEVTQLPTKLITVADPTSMVPTRSGA